MRSFRLAGQDVRAGQSVRLLAANADVDFEVKGKWVCSNRGMVIPLSGARVELWRERGGWQFDDKVGAAHTAGDGSFGFSVRAGSNFDLFVKLVLNDDRGVKLSNWYSFLGTEWNVNTSKTRSHSGLVDLGTREISRDNGAGTPKCAIWQGARNAYRDYERVIGSRPPSGNYSISADFPCCGTPFTETGTTRWPSGYQTGLGSQDPDAGFSVNFHEFAHSVRHSFDGGNLHFLEDVASYGYAQNHSPCKITNAGFAFNEGWAEYWARTPKTCGDGTSFNQEGNVATALTGLEKCADRPTMVRALRESPGSIHSYAEFRTKFINLVGPKACIIPPITGTETLEPTASPAKLTREVQAQLAAQKRLIANLKGLMKTATSDARNPGNCTVALRCLPEIEKLLAPLALNTQIAQANLVLRRLEAGLAAARKVAFMPDFAQPSFYEALEADRRAFERANQSIIIDGIHRSIQAIKSEERFSLAQSTADYRRLNLRLSLLTDARKHNRATPSQVASLFSAPSPPIDVTKRVRIG